jgi:hypothetical protein
MSNVENRILFLALYLICILFFIHISELIGDSSVEILKVVPDL